MNRVTAFFAGCFLAVSASAQSASMSVDRAIDCSLHAAAFEHMAVRGRAKGDAISFEMVEESRRTTMLFTELVERKGAELNWSTTQIKTAIEDATSIFLNGYPSLFERHGEVGMAKILGSRLAECITEYKAGS